MSLWQKLGITSRPATADEIAELDAIREAADAERTGAAYAYQEHQYEHGNEYGLGHLGKPVADPAPETSLFRKWMSKFPSASSNIQEPTREPVAKAEIETPKPSPWERMKASGIFSRTRDTIQAGAANVKNIPSRATAVGRSLANPETRKQVASELGLNMAVMGGAKIALGATMAGAGAPVLATFAGMTATTALVGGLLKSRRQYMDASQEGERSFKAFASHVWENRKQFTKNMAGSALVGALGGIAGGLLGEAWNHFHSSVPATPHIDPAPVHHDVTPVPAEQTAAPVLEPKLTAVEAQALKDQAVHTYWHGDKEQGLEMFQKAAEAGNVQAQRDYFELTGKHIGEVKPAAPALVEVAPKPAAPVTIPEAESGVSTDTILKVGGAVAATVTATAAVGANVLPAAALSMAQPKVDNAPPRTVQICQMRDIENSNQIGLRCPETPAFAQIRSGDTLRIQYTDSTKNITASEDIRNPAAAVPTKEYESVMANDASFMGSIRDKLRGYISEKFNRANTATSAVPVAANENELPPVAEATAPTPTFDPAFKEIFTRWTMPQIPAAPAPIVTVTPVYNTAPVFGGQKAVNDDILAATAQMPLAGVSPK